MSSDCSCSSLSHWKRQEYQEQQYQENSDLQKQVVEEPQERTQPQQGQMEHRFRSLQQYLVRFQNVTHAISMPCFTDMKPSTSSILRGLCKVISHRTGWSCQYLQAVDNFDSTQNPTFLTIRTKSLILGGKGGFGTLLKGQSRQAGAKLTTDFGACRDLQGRRLRHVNDEIKLRKWREMERAKQQNGGKEVSADALWNTPSGLYNWHLMTPTWADISKKATYKIKREFKQMERELQEKEMAKREQELVYQRSVTHYLDRTTTAVKDLETSIPDAIRQGLEASSKKRKRIIQEQQTQQLQPILGKNDSVQSPQEGTLKPSALCSLSGDVVVEYQPIKTTQQQQQQLKSTNDKDSKHPTVLQIQSKSDFSTVALVLDRSPSDNLILYYEVKLVTGGLAQIGWASLVSPSADKKDDNQAASTTTPLFSPNNDLGDGVGDDSASFGYDGSRGLKFHGGTEESYSDKMTWKAQDVLGCTWNVQSGSISYSLNGKDLGTAFASTKPFNVLFPAMSCNEGEILELHLKQEECQHFPEDAVAVQDLIVANEDVDGPSPRSTIDKSKESGPKQPQQQQKQKQKQNSEDSSSTAETTEITNTIPENTIKPQQGNDASILEPAAPKKEPVQAETLNLGDYNSAQELEILGLDRLKAASVALGIKCGGSLSERAARLFSIKGKDRKDYPMKVRAKGFVV